MNKKRVKQKRLMINVDRDIHKKAKVAAAVKGVPVYVIYNEALAFFMEKTDQWRSK